MGAGETVRGGAAGGFAESLGAGGLEERHGPGAETVSSRGPSLGMWEATGEGNLFLRSASVGSVGGASGSAQQSEPVSITLPLRASVSSPAKWDNTYLAGVQLQGDKAGEAPGT